MRWMSIVAVAVSGIIYSSGISCRAQAGPLRHKLTIRSTDLPAEERSLLESIFVCSSCTGAEVQSIVSDQVRGLGYFKAVISSPTVRPTEANDQHFFNDVVNVESGPRYYMNHLRITGATVFSNARLSKAVLLSAGSVFSSSLVGQSLENIRQVYASTGRTSVVINPTLMFDETRHTVSLTLNIDEG